MEQTAQQGDGSLRAQEIFSSFSHKEEILLLANKIGADTIVIRQNQETL